MLKAIVSGVAGAVVLNLVHETARRTIPHAPRMDVIGTRAIRRPMQAAGIQPPSWDRAHRIALAGDLVANSAYYAMAAVGDGRNARERGLILGLLAGIGGAVLPPILGLGNQPHRKTPVTHLLTVAWYTIGGVVAGEVARRLTRRRSRVGWRWE